MLVACIVLVFLMLLALSVAAPRVARGLEHEREVESRHRAEQYVRAIRVFYRKNQRYPTSLEQLKMTNNQRYLRQEYVDPLTGKPDWRLIHVGENKTKVKGLFGQDLPGLGGGLGLTTSGIGTPTTPATTTNPLSSTTPAGTTGPGTTGTSSTAAGQTVGGAIMGVGSNKSGEAMVVVNEQDRFENWEFLYDPRIEQLYAKGALNGGIGGGSATSTSSGTPTTTPNPTQPVPQQQ